MAGDQTQSLTSSSSKKSQTIGDRTLKGFGNLIKLLPSGTVFLFYFLNPILTNNGDCHTVNKYLAAALLFVCGFMAGFSSFTDSYTGSNGKLYYGLATRTGLWSFWDSNSGSMDLSKYKLRFADFVHAFLTLVVFAVVSLLDKSTVSCFYASFEKSQKVANMILPAAVGAAASAIFMVYPNTRHGIGYPPSQTTSNSSD